MTDMIHNDVQSFPLQKNNPAHEMIKQMFISKDWTVPDELKSLSEQDINHIIFIDMILGGGIITTDFDSRMELHNLCVHLKLNLHTETQNMLGIFSDTRYRITEQTKQYFRYIGDHTFHQLSDVVAMISSYIYQRALFDKTTPELVMIHTIETFADNDDKKHMIQLTVDQLSKSPTSQQMYDLLTSVTYQLFIVHDVVKI
jgi:hypothetical protein